MGELEQMRAKDTEDAAEHAERTGEQSAAEHVEKAPIEDIVAAKRLSSPSERRGQLISAERTLRVGRREAPAEEILKYERDRKRRVYIGLVLAAVVVVIALIVIMMLGSDMRIG